MALDLNSKEKVYTFLESHAVGVLSTVSADNKPHASPIYFVADNDLNFFFLTKSDTKKSQDIEKNNNVALTIVNPSLPLTIQVAGAVEETNNPEMYAKIAETNAAEKGGLHWPPPIHKLQHSGDLIMYKLTPNWLRVADFSDSEDMTKTTKEIFHQII
jgi:nitroimidazol reductase NimA-like FMN-containing flavoprotein (pyridoxamine 5'-phosphate oxidase superfamily)